MSGALPSFRSFCSGVSATSDVAPSLALTMQYMSRLPGHTPFFSLLGLGELSYRQGAVWYRLTCFWGFCEVLPDRVNVLAEMGERAADIDVARAERARALAAERMKTIKEEAGYAEAHTAYVRAVTRLAVARNHPRA